MNADLIARLRAQLGGPRDGALLRFSLGTALLSKKTHRDSIPLEELIRMLEN